MLWFGDERGYNATIYLCGTTTDQLWFGDERGYNATYIPTTSRSLRCGLVMKEDITQQRLSGMLSSTGCGLVMKEDITQQAQKRGHHPYVVVW